MENLCFAETRCQAGLQDQLIAGNAHSSAIGAFAIIRPPTPSCVGSGQIAKNSKARGVWFTPLWAMLDYDPTQKGPVLGTRSDAYDGILSCPISDYTNSLHLRDDRPKKQRMREDAHHNP